MGYALGMLAGICYGAWAVIAKTAIHDYEIPPLLFAAIAFFFGTIMFGPVLAYDGPWAYRRSKRGLAWFALSGIGSGGAIIALSFGLGKGDVTVVAPIVSISPLITLILVRIFLERLRRLAPPWCWAPFWLWEVLCWRWSETRYSELTLQWEDAVPPHTSKLV